MPISLAYVLDKSVDLAAVFQEVGMRVISCATYDGLEKNAVRINLHDEIELFKQLVTKADKLIGQANSKG